jgi:hypothetical protein
VQFQVYAKGSNYGLDGINVLRNSAPHFGYYEQVINMLVKNNYTPGVDLWVLQFFVFVL